MPRKVRGGDTEYDAFVRCRTYNHAWDEFNPIDLEAPSYGWRLSLRCIRCTTERHDTIAYRSGQILSRRYIYPDGYQNKGEDRPTKEVFREELFVRLRAQLESSHALGSENGNVTPITKKTAARKAAAVKKATVRKRA
jgi:hypothetical protein